MYEVRQPAMGVNSLDGLGSGHDGNRTLGYQLHSVHRSADGQRRVCAGQTAGVGDRTGCGYLGGAEYAGVTALRPASHIAEHLHRQRIELGDLGTSLTVVAYHFAPPPGVGTFAW
jgi:hypothetical protein